MSSTDYRSSLDDRPYSQKSSKSCALPLPIADGQVSYNLVSYVQVALFQMPSKYRRLVIQTYLIPSRSNETNRQR